MYDLRFFTMVKLWRHPEGSRICCLESTPHLAVAAGYAASSFSSASQAPPLALVSTANNVGMLYSLETGTCHRSFQAPSVEAAASAGRSGGFRRTAGFNLVCVPELMGVTNASALSRPVRVGAALAVDPHFDITSDAVLNEIDSAAAPGTYIRAMMCPAIDANGELYDARRSLPRRGARDGGDDAGGAEGNRSRSASIAQRAALEGPGGAAFVITASDDMHVRVWDLVKPEKSYSITGFEGRENKCVARVPAALRSRTRLLTHPRTPLPSPPPPRVLGRCTSPSTTSSEPSRRRRAKRRGSRCGHRTGEDRRRRRRSTPMR